MTQINITFSVTNEIHLKGHGNGLTLYQLSEGGEVLTRDSKIVKLQDEHGDKFSFFFYIEDHEIAIAVHRRISRHPLGSKRILFFTLPSLQPIVFRRSDGTSFTEVHTIHDIDSTPKYGIHVSDTAYEPTLFDLGTGAQIERH